ncbi:MAG: hypothetical protein LZF60_230104 [Nitrospira sp.]|nr:MAG: hypothetical protein LZF60_230104 [Nitrospira sp.]
MRTRMVDDTSPRFSLAAPVC